MNYTIRKTGKKKKNFRFNSEKGFLLQRKIRCNSEIMALVQRNFSLQNGVFFFILFYYMRFFLRNPQHFFHNYGVHGSSFIEFQNFLFLVVGA